MTQLLRYKNVEHQKLIFNIVSNIIKHIIGLSKKKKW